MRVKKYLSGILALALAFQTGAWDVPAAQVQKAADSATQVVSEPETVYVNEYGANEREVSFNDNWRFYLGELNGAEAAVYNDSAWRNVDLPHDYSIDQGFTTAAPAEQESGYVLGGTGWYRKGFTLSEELADKKVSVEFDGVYMNATVFLNGEQLGTHPNGYAPFAFELPSELLHFGRGENVLAVKVDHKQPSSRWYSGSGIYRDVTLTVTEPVHVAYHGTTVTTPDIDEGVGTVQVVADIENGGSQDETVSIRQVVYEAEGKEPVAVGEKTQAQLVLAGQKASIAGTVTVASPKLWTTEEPNLYTVRTEVYVGDTLTDTYESDFGFRWATFTKDSGFFLNGENIKLRGVCMHHDQGGLGSEAWYRSVERQVEILKEMGANAIRVTHNPASEVLIDICNRKGMMLVEEAFDAWLSDKAGNTEGYGGKWFMQPIEEGNQITGGKEASQWAEYDLKSMVKRGRNAPSIVMWSLGNEVFQQLNDSSMNNQFPDVAKSLIRWVGEEDATRFVTFGDNQVKGNVWANNAQVNTALVFADAASYGVPGGLVGFNYGSSDQIQNGYSRGWMVYGSETASSVNSRGVYDRKNSNSDGNIGDRRLTSYDKSCVGWGHLASAGLWITMQQPFNAGEFVWTGFDYIGEPTPYNWQGTGSNGTWPNVSKSSYFGIIDTAGFPKDSYYLYQSQWNGNLHTLHVLPVWDRDEIMIDNSGNAEVVVYSDAPVVKLYLNGEEIGSASAAKTETPTGGYQNYTAGTGCFDSSKAKGHTSLYATFLVKYEEGRLEAKAFEADGTTEITDTNGRSFVETTKAASKLSIKADRKEITADGKDLCYVTIGVTDADGKPVNGAEPEVTVSVEGAGKLLALDNGVQNDVTAHKEPARKAGKGKLLAIVQSTDKEGSFTVTANAPGYQDVEETVQTKAKAGVSQEKAVVSYEISRNYYLKPGTKPLLPKTVLIHYSDDTSETRAVIWDELPEGQALYAVEGTVEGLGLSVQVRVTEVGNVVGILNYSVAIGKDAEVFLPAGRPAVQADGTVMSAEFPVAWEVKEDLTAEAGTKEVKGTADVFGERYDVTALVRVTSGGYKDGDEALANVPEMYINGVSSKDNSGVAETLAGLQDDKTSKTDVAWTGRGTLDFRLDTAIELKNFTMYLKDTAPVSGTMKVYSSSDNGANWVQAPCRVTNRRENGVTVRTFTPAETISETYFRIEFEKITTLLELEMNTRIPTFPIGSTAGLSALRVGGHKADTATLQKGWYGILDTTLTETDVKAEGKDNASVTILPKDDNNVIRILLESEDHTARSIYQVLIGEDNTKVENASDASLDYPYQDMILSAPSYHGDEPAGQAADGKANTIWHSRWGNSGAGEKDLRDHADLRYLQIELKDAKAIQGLRYLPRPTDKNGIVLSYRIDVSTDGENWVTAANGTGWNAAVEWKMVQFDAVEAKYIRLYGVETADNNGNAWNEFMSAAEVRVQCVASEIHEGNTTVTLPNGADEADYTGNAITPKPVVTYRASKDVQGVVLTEGSDYRVSYENNIEPGRATVVVTGTGSYAGVVETGFTIRAVDVKINGYEQTSITTGKGEYPALPSAITADTNIGSQLMEVRWDSIGSSLLQTFGTFTVYGTIVENNDRVAAKVTVSDVIGVRHVTLTTPIGAALAMPEQVTVYYSNGETAKHDVLWNLPEGGFDTEGIVTVLGKAGKADVKATVRVVNAAADKYNTPASANLALNENGKNAPTSWPRTHAYISASGDLAHNATDGVKDFVSGFGKQIWSDWENGVYHTNADAAVGANDHLPFVASTFGVKGSAANEDQKKYTVNKVLVGFMEEDGDSAHKVCLPEDYKIEYYSANGGVIPAARLVNNAASECSNTRGWGADNPIKAHEGWTEVSYIGGKPAIPQADNFQQMVDIAFEPVETTSIRITLTPKAENWTGLEEFEVYYEPVAKYDSYEVSSVQLDGKNILADFDEATKTLEVEADTGVITAQATNNASVTVLEAVNGVAKVIFLPENADETKKQEYTVKFRQAQEKETYVIAAEEAEVELPKAAAAGETVTFSAKDGYAFTELPVIARSETNEPTGITVTQSGNRYTFIMPAYAVTIRGSLKELEEQVYTVTFESNGGTLVAPQEVPSTVGVASEPDAPKKRGYDFAGWFTDSSLSAAWNFASAVTRSMTLYAKWVPAKITVNTKMEAYLFGDTGYQLPEKLNISVTGETFNTAVAWNEADVARLFAAEELSANTVKGTLTEFENREVTVSVTASPGNIVYFADCGASEFTELGQLLLGANQATIKNTVPDSAYSDSAGWGYTNPEAELEVNGSGDAYDSIRNFKSGNNGKTLSYQFALEAGTYEVATGFYDPWSQWAQDYRHAKVSVTDLLGAELASKADHHISGKELVTFTDITLEKNSSISVNAAPLKSGNDNCDVMISFIVIRKTADFTNGKAALASAVAIAERLSADGYTAATYAVLQAAVQQAKEVLKAGASTADEVQAAADAVANAIAGLKFAGDEENEQLKADLAEIQKELSEARGQVTELETQLGEADTRIGNLEKDIAAKEKEIAGLNKQVKEKEAALKTANDKLTDLKAELNGANADNARLLAQISEKETEISILNDRIAALNVQLEMSEDQKGVLLDELKNVKEEAGVLEIKLAAAQARAAQLEGMADRLQKEADDARKQLEQAREEIQKLLKAAEQKPAVTRLKVGDKADFKGVMYRVTNAEKKLAEAYDVSNRSMVGVHVMHSVKIGGTTCKVTAIADHSFEDMKRLRRVLIGKNVTSIGKKAFEGDAKLVKITIRNKKLSKIGKNAFKGVSAKAKVYVPKGRVKAFGRLLKGKGLNKAVQIKAEKR